MGAPLAHRWRSWRSRGPEPATAGRRRRLAVGLALTALIASALTTAPAAEAAQRHRSLERFEASVSRVRLLADGTVRIRVAVLCPRSAPGDLTVLRTVTVALTSSADDAFQPGQAELSVRVGAHCPRTPVGNESICRSETVFAYPVTLRAGRSVRPLPRLHLSRAVRLP